MRMLAVLALAAAIAAVPAIATVGGDVSQPFSTATFQCTRNNGWDFVIVRSFYSFGAPDPNARGTLDNAKAAGIPYRDVYHFPCRGKDASAQVSDDVNAVGKDNFGTLWFDIETNPSPGCGWSGDKGSNCQFLGDMINAGKSIGIRMGVYSSEYMWSSIMGDCNVGASNGLPIWYAHYDHNPSFSDWSSFGGWGKPAMKQYWDGVGICGINADADWYP